MWKSAKIGDVCDIRRGASPRPIQNFLSDKGMPWVKIADATADSSRYITETKECIIPEGISKSLEVHPDDLIVSNSATPGLPKIMKIDACIHDGWLLLSNFRDVTRDFLYYKFIDIRSHLVNQANGSVFQNLKTDIVRDFDIRIPSIAEQNKIVETLHSLDDKIELNNQINRNLEEQAQAIFKSWFIDFEPFGGIKPEDWNEVCLKDCCSSITDGVHNTVIDDPDGDFYLLSCKNIKGGVLSIGSDERKINKETFDKLRKRTKLAKGDILLSSVGTVGEMLLLTKDPENIEFQRSVAIIKAERNLISPEFLYNSLIAQKDTIVNAAHGAVQQCIFLSDIGDFKTILPTSEYMNKYTLLVSPYYEQISKNQDENMHLISMRDTLLPKLMSGGMELSR